ncbi:uncharacterized protein SCHCODRAFT_01316357 [Schizophyllum commune H4-8]|uniref:uncharacterized protein n=1 Tax=Schizophyllum commune (strain H4-8 / FGSC 9210) TaxID=578458 RepID=UPI00215E3109|nr:uncharacterized protein SCHCODRAFT_01316357 [Schizophyllum commune H4-8]KAI5890222.1 hypothetical protein SCHCODRAFT_01316357 [Schizophyllum commune H4-8]
MIMAPSSSPPHPLVYTRVPHRCASCPFISPYTHPAFLLHLFILRPALYTVALAYIIIAAC